MEPGPSLCTHVSLSLRLTLTQLPLLPHHQMASRLDDTDLVQLGNMRRKDWNQMR